ncbi:hypothetical protein H7F51_16520 [Novosphingobium flavum]|uniref:Uncharacterized protein n=1 Tax=Novosphingobium flavum TaxID=1778672 RepID=A0A7X1KN98_9SPHN|nr:hypothetical protein [Novosphingobium flavum]MBC2667125.1 hypothetical protein [Novosphingobium flavum]
MKRSLASAAAAMALIGYGGGAMPGAAAQPAPSNVATAQPPAAEEGYRPVEGPHTLNPGEWPAHYPFADRSEAAIAAPEVHSVRYVDAKVRLVEVGYFPGVVGNVHGHPFPSVFAVDAPVPKSTNTMTDPKRNMIAAVGQAPEGAAYPICRAATPQFPHHETNLDTWPHHFLRLEFKRIDGKGLAARWRDWYRYTQVGPDGTRLLYEDDHARLVEVLVRPGETRRVPASAYPAVIAYDIAGTPAPVAKGGHASPPLSAFETLGCATTGPAPVQTTRNTSAVPIHYYRIEFKRIDGDGLKDHWQEWYPWMKVLEDAYERSPNPRNF